MDQNTFLHSVFTRFLLVGVIALLATLFLWQSLEAVKPAPRYENFCTEEITSKTVNDEMTCQQSGGKWEEVKGVPDQNGYCNTTFECQQKFTKAEELYSGTAFLVLFAAGVILILFGVLLRGSVVITNGLVTGGALTLFTGSVSHWVYLFPLAKVLLLGAALVAILYLTWTKFKD